MKHLLINEAYFITSSVNDKKISAQLLHLKKWNYILCLQLSKQMNLMWIEWHNNWALYSTSYEGP